MNIESQVCNLDLSIKLKSLNVKQESLFYHHWQKKNRDYEYIDHTIEDYKLEDSDDGKWMFKCYSAFTASELLELLPVEISRDLIKYTYLVILKKNHEYEIRYDSCRLDDTQCIEFGDTLTNSLAKMLIYLIENKILDI
jgi:hypothetical protein